VNNLPAIILPAPISAEPETSVVFDPNSFPYHERTYTVLSDTVEVLDNTRQQLQLLNLIATLKGGHPKISPVHLVALRHGAVKADVLRAVLRVVLKTRPTF
jgi:hypothetical protein